MGAYFDAIFKTFTFSGRTSRKDFFMFILFDIIVTIALLAIEYEVSDFPYVSVFYFFVLGLTRSAITSRRLHDTGRSFSTVWSYSIGSVILGAIGAVFPWVFILQFLVGVSFFIHLCESSDYLNEYGPTPAHVKLPPRPEKQKKEETKADEPKVNQQSTNEYFKDNSSMVDNLLSKVNNEKKNNNCRSCGSIITPQSKFCGNCGTKYEID